MNKEEFINEFNDWTKEEILGRAFKICCKNIELKEIEKEHRKINGELRVENKELKKQLEKYENPEDMTLMMIWATEKVKDENKELKDRIDKAIEYINKKAIKKEIQETRNIVNIIYSLKLNNYEFIELEDILKGDKE